MVGWNHDGAFKDRACARCGTMFAPKSGHQKYCSQVCKDRIKHENGSITTESQYQHISGNWERYFSRLMAGVRRTAKFELTRADLLMMHGRQGGKCAVSGVEMTCTLVKGSKLWTNASIDRIIPGQAYTIDNVHLVCHAMNMWRSNVPLEEFIWWCKQVAEHRS